MSDSKQFGYSRSENQFMSTFSSYSSMAQQEENYRRKYEQPQHTSVIRSNVNMRRDYYTNVLSANDPDYRMKRNKNNESAKRSRESRKEKEAEVEAVVDYMLSENVRLKLQMGALELEKIRLTEELERRKALLRN